jgi:NAD(P)-dependent dehydrogenase (short-subunit alcohol dehydrogenase family)
MPSVLITGASRGIGLELVRQYQAEGWRVLATCRNPGEAKALAALKPVAIERLDVADHASIKAAARKLEGEAIDVLFNNAGIIGTRGLAFGTFDYDVWDEVMRVNAFGPIAVAEAFMPHLERGTKKTIVAVTSMMGSIGRTAASNECIYRSSKAALNMAMKCMAIELAPKGMTAVMFHPGHVKTDMGGPAAPVGIADSASGMRAVLAKVGQADNGKFYNFDGAEIPW